MAEEVAVPDESGENIFYVRAGRMPWGVNNRVQGAAFQINIDMAGGKPKGVVAMAAYNAALMLHNILRWEGPALTGFTLTQAGLDTIDAGHGDAVLAEINRQNKPKASPNPKSPAPNT